MALICHLFLCRLIKRFYLCRSKNNIMKNILPWIPIFGGIYCQNFATVYFRNVELQIANFMYHIGLLLILIILL